MAAGALLLRVGRFLIWDGSTLASVAAFDSLYPEPPPPSLSFPVLICRWWLAFAQHNHRWSMLQLAITRYTPLRRMASIFQRGGVEFMIKNPAKLISLISRAYITECDEFTKAWGSRQVV